MIQLTGNELLAIRPLCGEIRDVVIQAALEGNLGNVWADRKVDPECAIVAAADFCYLLGKPKESDKEHTAALLSAYAKGNIIISNILAWISMVRESFPETFHAFKRYAIKKEPNAFDKQRLQSYVEAVLPEFEVVPFDESLFHLAGKENWTADFCMFFRSCEDFLQNGLGYAIVDRETGRILSGASSYTYCQGRISVTIGTAEEFRRRGLAQACAAKLILECLDRGIYPEWDAVGMHSVALAETLGYRFDKEYEVFTFK